MRTAPLPFRATKMASQVAARCLKEKSGRPREHAGQKPNRISKLMTSKGSEFLKFNYVYVSLAKQKKKTFFRYCST